MFGESMHRDDVLAELTAERLDLCSYLEQLGSADWEVSSLCAGWTVHDVLAHLVANTEETVLGLFKGLIRAHGSFDRMVDRQAHERAAACSPEVLITQLRDAAASPRRPLGSQPIDPLCDVLIHGQDIARPIGRPRAMAPHRAVPALQHAATSRFYGARKRFRGIRLTATDAEWTLGGGSVQVQGPVSDLLLVATGRAAGLERLSGDGLAVVTERLAEG